VRTKPNFVPHNSFLAYCDVNTPLFPRHAVLYRIGVLTHSIVLIAGYLVYAKFSFGVAVEVKKHLQVAQELYKNSNDDQRSQVRVFENILESVRS
jgi:hypothetical protein